MEASLKFCNNVISHDVVFILLNPIHHQTTRGKTRIPNIRKNSQKMETDEFFQYIYIIK